MWFLSARRIRRASVGVRPQPSYRPSLEALEKRDLLSAGALDLTFGTGGMVVKDYGIIDPLAGSAAVRSLYVYPTTDAANAGKILAAGYAAATNVTHTGDDFAVLRYNADGTPDTTFGTNGIVTTDFNSQPNSSTPNDDIIYGLVIDGSGKIVVAGSSQHLVMLSPTQGINVPEFALARYTSAGQLDTNAATGFGPVDPTTGLHSGKFTTVLPGETSTGGGSIARAIALQPDGRLVVAGQAYSASGISDFALARYNSDGLLDSNFGSGGLVTTPIPVSWAYARAMVLQGDGKIVLAGSAYNGTDDDFAAARYNSNGTLDSTFGSGGTVTTAIAVSPATPAANDLAAALALDAGGRLVLAGYTTNSSGLQDTALVRYSTSGTLDTTFGSNGKAVADLGGNDMGRALAIQPDGKIVVAGSATFTATSKDFALARFNSNGSLDSNFGSGGEVTTALATGNDEAIAVALQTDGKIIAGGYVNRGLALARYLGDPTTSPVAASQFIVTAPVNVTAGTPFTETVTATDAFGNVASAYAGTVHFTSSDSQAVLPGNVTLQNGTGTFRVTLLTVGVQTLTATDTTANITGTAPSNVVVGPAVTQFRVTATPSAAAGTAFNLTVTAADANGNAVTGCTGTVHFTSTDGKAVLPANYTFKASDSGVHTFSVLLKTAGTRSVTVTDTQGLTGSDYNIVVSPAAASQFAFTFYNLYGVVISPASITAGTQFSVRIAVEDAYGNVVTGYTGTVHFTDSVSGATLPANYTFTAADSGMHLFTGLVLKKRGTQTLTVTDTHNSSIFASVLVNVQ